MARSIKDIMIMEAEVCRCECAYIYTAQNSLPVDDLFVEYYSVVCAEVGQKFIIPW